MIVIVIVIVMRVCCVQFLSNPECDYLYARECKYTATLWFVRAYHEVLGDVLGVWKIDAQLSNEIIFI